jgi:hyaluronan synthase
VNVEVQRRVGLGAATAAVVFLGFGLWGAHHAIGLIASIQGRGSRFGLVFTIAFVMLVVQTVMYHLERPYRTTESQDARLAKLFVTVSVPVYNESPDLLERCLHSMLTQSRKPQLVYVVDDGSTKVEYDDVRAVFEIRAREVGVATRWVKTENGGKRHAQGVCFADSPDTDIYVTVDSDAYLPVDSIEEVLKPFADRRVQSVAGVVLASNATKNLLTRLTDLWFVTGQLVDRSAASVTGSVLVNSGPLAAYRRGVIEDNLHAYLNETFFGRRVEFSDDSMLTIYALLRGRAVQQPTAFSLTAMPESLSHHVRQYLRWMRGAFIRSWWRFKYLPLRSFAYWNHAMAWTQMALSTMLFLYLFAVEPAITGKIAPWLLVVPLSIGGAQATRYLTVRRSDMPLWSQLLTVAMSPLATAWAFFVLRVLRWYAMATCLKMGWNTRQNVEVAAVEAAPTRVAITAN